MLKNMIKKLINIFFSNYEIYKIFSIKQVASLPDMKSSQFCFIELNDTTIKNFNSELVQLNIGYTGDNANGFACLYNDEIVGVCFFWSGERYLSRNFWPLQSGEAKLVQIETLSAMKGKGVAPSLINYSSQKMHEKQFKRLYARIWHSNIPSIKCFKKAGWSYLTTVITFTLPFAIKVKFRWPFSS